MASLPPFLEHLVLQGGAQLPAESLDSVERRLKDMVGGAERSSIVLDKVQRVQAALCRMQAQDAASSAGTIAVHDVQLL